MTHRSDATRRRLALAMALCLVGLGAVACKPKVKVEHRPLNPDHGETVTFEATAEDSDGIASIEIRVNGAVVKTCSGSSTCTWSGVPSTGVFDLVSYEARATDRDEETGSDGPYSFAVGVPWMIDLGFRNYQPPFVPVRTTGRDASEAIDVCFVAADDYGGNRARFMDDVRDKIFERLFENEPIERNRRKYNFWASMGPASAASCGTVPTSLRRAGTFCDVFAVLHRAELRDCTIGDHFSAEGYNTKAFVHESGHAIFGLADEYEGDTAYFQPSPHPNIWRSEAACRADAASFGGDPDECNEFCDDPHFCGSGWWRYTRNRTVMTWGMWNEPWGRPAERRLGWVHGQY